MHSAGLSPKSLHPLKIPSGSGLIEFKWSGHIKVLQSLNAIKPDPEGILRGCKDLGLHPAECIYVGDHEKDLEAGINAGTQVIACYFGYSLKAGDHREHVHGVNHPNELYELISQL